MNYRHIYHAGNFADVFKHVVLMLCLEYLGQKDKPYFVLDTHAGVGRYELEFDEAKRTGEAAEGIALLWDDAAAPEIVRRYVALVKRFNHGGVLRRYPGSPLIMQALLRAQDRLVANELHPEDVRMLRHVLGGDDRAKVEQMDGYQLWKASVPPPERRGLVLVDPPFEARNEFEMMAEGLRQADRRWATGMSALWYPIKDGAAVQAFHEDVRASGIKDVKAYEFYLREDGPADLLNGCGMLMVNAPWTLQEQMQGVMPYLVERLTDGEGRFVVTEIASEG